MSFLITGGTGLVGSFLLEKIAANPSLKERGCRVVVRNTESKMKVENLGLTPFKADLNDIKSLKNAIKDVSSVIHLAARADDWATWKELYRANVEGLENLVSVCRNANSDPFVSHTSSTGVYGHYIPSTPITESYRFNPTSIYQKSKYYQEKYLWKLKDQEGWSNFSLVRSPSIIGPRDTKTIGAIFKAVYEHKFPILRGGNMYATFIHPFDLSTALLLLDSKKSRSKGQAYNIKSFESKMIDFLEYVVKLVNPPKLPSPMNYHMVYTVALFSELFSKLTGRKTTLNRYRVTKFAKTRRYDDTKIRTELNFLPEKNMELTLNESYEWLTADEHFPPKQSMH
ncbi:MAG: NAD-dependent epimerase/dehydratase family protein [Candidatus Hodarchaeales archaeon]